MVPSSVITPRASAESRFSPCTTLSAATTAEAPQMAPPTPRRRPSFSPTASRRATHQPKPRAAKVEIVTTASAGAPILNSSPMLSRKPSPATAQRRTGRCAIRIPGSRASGTWTIDFQAMPSRMTRRSALRWSVPLMAGSSASASAAAASATQPASPGSTAITARVPGERSGGCKLERGILCEGARAGQPAARRGPRAFGLQERPARAGVRGVGELAVFPAVAARVHGVEDVAVGHLAAVHVDRDRGSRIGILDLVVLEGRDQSAGLGDPRHHLGLLAELDDVLLGIAAMDRERRDADAAAVDALAAPHAGMVVERRSLSLVPDQDQRGVAAPRIAMQEPARVAIGRRLEIGRGDELLAA